MLGLQEKYDYHQEIWTIFTFINMEKETGEELETPELFKEMVISTYAAFYPLLNGSKE